MDVMEEQIEGQRQEIVHLQSGMQRIEAMLETLIKDRESVRPAVVEVPNPVVTAIAAATTSQPWGVSPNFTPNEHVPLTSGIPHPHLNHVFMTMPTPTPVIETPARVNILQHQSDDDSMPNHVTPTEPACTQGGEVQLQIAELTKKLKALEGKELFGKNAQEMCLVKNVLIPRKFKVPDFEKFKGDGCPQTHLTMYCRKMAAHTDDDKLLIHYFQDSLTGASAKWYMSLDGSKIKSFTDLGEAFIRQYKYNLDTAPDREQLRGMSQNHNETFKQYAQRWRELAVQIEPPMSEKEMTKLFINTLPPFYYEKMIGSAPHDFTDTVGMGIRLEQALKEGRLKNNEASTSGPKKYGFQRKKEGDTNAVSTHNAKRCQNYVAQTQHQPRNYQPRPQVNIYPTPPPQNYQPPIMTPRPLTIAQGPLPRAQKPKTVFDPIPMTYAELFPSLIQNNLVQTRTPPTIPNPLPVWFKPELKCIFHQGAPGHDIENCYPLKARVQELVREGILKFQDSDQPNVRENPMPKHKAAAVEAGRGLITKIEEVRTPFAEVHAKLCQSGILKAHKDCSNCKNNPNECCIVKNDIQRLLDDKILEISSQERTREVSVITPHFTNKREPKASSSKVVITIPSSSPVIIKIPKSSKSTEWAMSPCTSKGLYWRNKQTSEGNKEEAEVRSVAEPSNMTRSGRIYAPHDLLQRRAEKAPITELVKGSSKPTEVAISKGTNVEENDEILKLIKRSEYRVVDQLLNTPSKISILSLLLNSEAHREPLRKLLELAYVERDITTDQFTGLVGNIMSGHSISFTDEDLPASGRKHNDALHISVKCGKDVLSRVLVDTGSSLNVLPKTSLERLSYSGSSMRPSTLIVNAFDGSKRAVIGEIDLPLVVGPKEFMITFYVMDIHPSYSCLLGRPWIHQAGAVTSTLHQKLKFPYDNQVIIVSCEEDIMVSHLSDDQYIGVETEELGTKFQALEVAFATHLSSFSKAVPMGSLKDAIRALKTGDIRGWGTLLSLPENIKRAGLGYKPGMKQRKKTSDMPLEAIFRSAGFEHQGNQVAMVGMDEAEEHCFVTCSGTSAPLNNWRAEDSPHVVHLSK